MADRASRRCPWWCTRCGPIRGTEAHKTDGLAELVCSNSFRSDDAANNAVGLLHEEMRRAGSLIMTAGDAHKLPAGGALAVDRDHFSAHVTSALAEHPLVTIERGEIAGLPPPEWDSVIIATGPLTSPALSAAIRQLTGETELAFFDAIAPDRAPGVHRRWRHLAPVALRQAGARRHRRRLHQLPHDAAPSTTRSSTRCSPPRRPRSRNGRPARPTSTAACPSR